jgi:hypothetical protein
LRRRAVRVGLTSFLVIVCLQPCLLHAQQSTPSTTQLQWVRPRERSADSTTQHSLSLAESTSRRTAGAESDASVAVLRWRTPGVARAKISSEESTAGVKVVTVSGTAHERGLVRQVLATAPAIPYSEPTESDAPLDGLSHRGLPPQELPSANGDRPLMVDLVAQVQVDEPALESEPATPAMPNDWPQDDPPPAPQPLPEPAPRPLTGQQSKGSKADCDRVYNERNCCEDDQRCSSARQFWQRDALAKISLDITPQLRPEETDPYKEESQRNADLSKAPVRAWRDRQGHVVATGRLNNIQRGRLLVLDENNQIVKIPFRDLCDDDLCFLTAWWRVPTECTLGDENYLARSWQPSTLTWKATGVCHKPLYFEEPQLERYGHTTGHIKQPLLSGAHFFLNLVALPYNAGINPPWECQYPLGYYRPGSCAPWLVPPVPLSVRGALWEAGAIVGGIAIIP